MHVAASPDSRGCHTPRPMRGHDAPLSSPPAPHAFHHAHACMRRTPHTGGAQGAGRVPDPRERGPKEPHHQDMPPNEDNPEARVISNPGQELSGRTMGATVGECSRPSPAGCGATVGTGSGARTVVRHDGWRCSSGWQLAAAPSSQCTAPTPPSLERVPPFTSGSLTHSLLPCMHACWAALSALQAALPAPAVSLLLT